jgi:hypothetical protein
MTFKQIFLAVVTMLVGGYSLADIWAGFISACISSLIVLRVYHGREFAHKVKLMDILIWILGVFISMRCWSLIAPYSPFSDKHFNDSVIIGFVTGAVNTYLYVKNYDPIKKLMNKYLK